MSLLIHFGLALLSCQTSKAHHQSMDLGDCLIDNTGLSKMNGWQDHSLSLIENIKLPYQHHDLESYDSPENETGLHPRMPLSMKINHAHNN